MHLVFQQMEEKVIIFQYEFDITGKRVPVRARQSDTQGFINCLDLTKILLEIEYGEAKSVNIKPEEVAKITNDIIQIHGIKTIEEFYAESGKAVGFLKYADQFSKNNTKEYQRLVDWLGFWLETATATALENIGEHLAFAPLLYQHDKLLEAEGVDRDEKRTLNKWLQDYCGIQETSLISSLSYKKRQSIAETVRATKQREPDKSNEGFIYDRSEFAAILGTIRQLTYGNEFPKRFQSYFYNLPKETEGRGSQIRRNFYKYKQSGKLKNISDSDLEVAIINIWGRNALKHTGTSQLPYSVDLFKRLLLNANITGRAKNA